MLRRFLLLRGATALPALIWACSSWGQVPCSPGDDPNSCGPEIVSVLVRQGAESVEFRLPSGLKTKVNIRNWKAKLLVAVQIRDSKSVTVAVQGLAPQAMTHGSSLVVPSAAVNASLFGSEPISITVM